MNFISRLGTKIVWTRYKGCLAKNPRNKSFKARYIYNLDINPPSPQKWNVLHCWIIIMKKPHANLINSSKINWQQKRKVFTTANSQTLMKNIFAQYLKIKLKVSFSLNYLNDTFLVDFKTLCWLEEPLICHIWDTILQAIIN